jgi:sugar lactone lactonase YvrE
MEHAAPASLAAPAPAILGEGPVWDAARGVVWWIDIEGKTLHCHSPDSGANRSYDLGQRVGAVACCDDGRLVAALHHGFFYLDPQTSQLEPIADPEADLPDNRFNDGKCDPQGRFWAGTMNLDPLRRSTGALYSLDAHGGVARHFGGIGVSNGLAWTADGSTLYYIDSLAGTIDAFDFDGQAGTLAGRRAVFQVPQELGAADGMTIDENDRLWVAFWGGWCVAQIDPVAGKLLQRIAVPTAHVTSCTFGGARRERLYITTARHGLEPDQLAAQPLAGQLFVAEPGVCGPLAVAFRTAN